MDSPDTKTAPPSIEVGKIETLKPGDPGWGGMGRVDPDRGAYHFYTTWDSGHVIRLKLLDGTVRPTVGREESGMELLKVTDGKIPFYESPLKMAGGTGQLSELLGEVCEQDPEAYFVTGNVILQMMRENPVLTERLTDPNLRGLNFIRAYSAVEGDGRMINPDLAQRIMRAVADYKRASLENPDLPTHQMTEEQFDQAFDFTRPTNTW